MALSILLIIPGQGELEERAARHGARTPSPV